MGNNGMMIHEEAVAAFAAYLDALIAVDDFSGVVLIARDGVPIFTRVHGLASVAYQAPILLDTKMNLGSMNKMFTAVAIVQLAEQGKLAFEDHIGAFLPHYPRAVADTVTVHHLLTHTAGLGDFLDDRFEGARARLRTVSDYLSLFIDDPLAFAPGQRWQYSNAGYGVLGAIIEAATDQSYFDYVREHIFQPAGMDNTDAYELDRDTPNLAMGYTRGDVARTLRERNRMWRTDQTSAFSPGPRRNNIFMLPVKGGPFGGGYSTVEDLLRFDRALRSHVLLRPSSTEILLAGKVDLPGEPEGRYAYGFRDERINGQRLVGHNGGFWGVNGQLDMYLDSGYTVAVLANYDPLVAHLIASKLRELLTQTALPCCAVPDLERCAGDDPGNTTRVPRSSPPTGPPPGGTA
ncbi:MAG TPA: serine hydrolase domain-containing protein [Chloroflexota bacterium]|nr:serine hydrolase domain-containing protein [Chloroflexota bacterium]